MSDETESLSAILASARTSLEDDSWIDEITAPDEDGQPNDYARRVVPLDDVFDELDRIRAAAERERTIALDRLRDLVRRLANMAETALVDCDDYADGVLRPYSFVNGARALIREARAAIREGSPVCRGRCAVPPLVLAGVWYRMIERDRLRDLVRRMLPFVEYTDAFRPPQHERRVNLTREARAAIREGGSEC